MATPKDFAIALLNRMGLPVTQNNVVSLVAFIGIEGTWPAGKNPFNSMLRMPGSTSRTSLGVQSYPTWEAGLEANAKTLAQQNMRGIVAALRANVDPQTFLRALSDSPWCSDLSTVANRSPKCNMEQGVLTHCYCDYGAFNANALYNQWANRDDASGSIATGSMMVWAKQHPLLTAGAVALFVGGAVYALWPELLEGPLRSARRALAMENPTSRKPGRGHSRVQTLLFSRSSFTPSSAKTWARSHGYKSGKVDVTDKYIRLRQADPGRFSRMRTITFKPGLKAVVGFP